MALKDLLENQIDLEESLPGATDINEHFWELINEGVKSEEEIIQDIVKYDRDLAIRDISDEIERRKKKELPVDKLEDYLLKLKGGKIEESVINEDVKDELEWILYKMDDEKLKKRLKKVIDELPGEKIAGDLRKIVKFKDDGQIYYKELKGVMNVNALIPVLKERIKDDPIIVAGDLSGMADLNNLYGRDLADNSIEKALMLFSKMMSEYGTVASPSGDEIWFVPNKDLKARKIAELLTEYLKRLNETEIKTDKEKFGLNAKFYIGKTSFDKIESLLKYMPDSKDSVLPGTIKVEGELFGEKGEKIYPTHRLGVSKLPRPPLDKEDEIKHALVKK